MQQININPRTLLKKNYFQRILDNIMKEKIINQFHNEDIDIAYEANTTLITVYFYGL